MGHRQRCRKHIVHNRGERQQICILKHKSNVLGPMPCARIGRKLVDIGAADRNSASVRTRQPTENEQECRLAAAAGTVQGDKLTRVQLQRRGVDRGYGFAVALGKTVG